MARTMFDDLTDKVADLELVDTQAEDLLDIMHDYAKRYPRSIAGLRRMPGFVKLWDALEEACRSACMPDRNDDDAPPPPVPEFTVGETVYHSGDFDGRIARVVEPNPDDLAKLRPPAANVVVQESGVDGNRYWAGSHELVRVVPQRRRYAVWADHAIAKYGCSDAIATCGQDGDKWYASMTGYGCSKSYATPEDAIRCMLLEHACSNIRTKFLGEYAF